jgi:neuroligin
MRVAAFFRWILTIAWVQSALAKVFPTQVSQRIVYTQYGPLRGILVTLPNTHLQDVEAYYGLQYASLLSGDLRFMPPTSPMDKWDQPRLAMKFKPVCPQRLPNLAALQNKIPFGRVEHFQRLIPFLEDQAEECLNLNLYVPTGKARWMA